MHVALLHHWRDAEFLYLVLFYLKYLFFIFVFPFSGMTHDNKDDTDDEGLLNLIKNAYFDIYLHFVLTFFSLLNWNVMFSYFLCLSYSSIKGIRYPCFFFDENKNTYTHQKTTSLCKESGVKKDNENHNEHNGTVSHIHSHPRVVHNFKRVLFDIFVLPRPISNIPKNTSTCQIEFPFFLFLFFYFYSKEERKTERRRRKKTHKLT